MQTIKFVHFLVGRKIATARRVYSSPDCSSLFIGKSIHAGTTRFDFAGHLSEFFLVL